MKINFIFIIFIFWAKSKSLKQSPGHKNKKHKIMHTKIYIKIANKSLEYYSVNNNIISDELMTNEF